MMAKKEPKKYKAGGPVVYHSHGLIPSDVPGRTDKLNISVPENSFVVPADIVSAVGEGNTEAGAKHFDRVYPMKGAESGNKKVPIVAAGGEYIINPKAIAAKHNGLDRGHEILRHLVAHVRQHAIHTLSNLEPPKK